MVDGPVIVWTADSHTHTQKKKTSQKATIEKKEQVTMSASVPDENHRENEEEEVDEEVRGEKKGKRKGGRRKKLSTRARRSYSPGTRRKVAR